VSNSIQYLDLPGIFGAIQQIQGGQQKSRLLDLQSQMEQQKLTTAAAKLGRQQELFGTITDPNERRLAELDPEAYAKAKAESLYGKPDLMAVPKGGGVYDKRTGQVVFSQPDNDVYFGDTPPAAPPSPSTNLQRAAPTPQPAATAPPVPVTPAGGAGFPAAIKAGENTTGNPAAPNPNSSAVGDHQFLAGTWLDAVKTHYPDIAAGRTDEQILKLREDPIMSANITNRYAADNTKVLQGAGFEATPTNLAIAHRYGPTGAVRILTAEKANPNTPLASVLSPEALAANPELKDLTIAQGRARLEGHMQEAGGGGTQGNYEIRYEKGKPTEYPGKPGYVVAREKGTGRIVAVPAPNAGQTQADIDRAEKDRRDAADKDARTRREAVRTMTTDEVAQHGLPSGTLAQIDGNGRISILKPVDPAAAKPTNDQTLAHGFANRMQATLGTINQLEEKGWKGPGFLERNVGDLPGGNYAMSAEYQQYERAKRDFISAILRKESGAAIGKDEYSSADRQYFPQPGDDPAALADKKRARDLAVRNMREASGPLNKPAANAGDFGKMTRDQLLAVDPATMTAEQKTAYLAALRAQP